MIKSELSYLTVNEFTDYETPETYSLFHQIANTKKGLNKVPINSTQVLIFSCAKSKTGL